MFSVPKTAFAGVILAVVSAAQVQEQNPDRAQIVQQVSRSLALFEKMGNDWKMPCASCHHQGLNIMALGEARLHGIPVNEKAAHDHAAKTLGSFLSADAIDFITQMPLDPNAFGYSMMAGYAQGVKSNPVFGVGARRFLNAQLPDGHWAVNDGRPPFGASVFSATALAIRSMSLYLPERFASERKECFERARQFLNTQPAASTDDRAFQLLGLTWANASTEERQKAASELLHHQRSDGGWAQLDGMESDAYSTGEALLALRKSGIIHATDGPFRRGVKYLQKSQQPDGTWHVKTRLYSPAPISPPYFETGFPYNRDQVISSTGTAWAIMALMQALPEVQSLAQPMAIPQMEFKDLQPWMNAALFGSVDDLRKLLDTGLNPNQATEAGTSLLMMSANDADKVRLLLQRGANVNAATKSGATALVSAATWRRTATVVRLLLDAGASATPKGLTGQNTPLFQASMLGDLDTVELLVDYGADVRKNAGMTGEYFATPLINAVMSDNPGLIRLLAAKGADVDTVDPMNMTALHWAALMHRTSVIKTLLQLGADPNRKDKFGYTPLRHTNDIHNMEIESAHLLETGKVITASLQQK
jgi:ankyrin repeat protein